MSELGTTCEESGGNFGQQYADCSSFTSSAPYYGVFFDGASHPAGVLCLKEQAESYGKEISGGQPFEIKPVLVWIQRPKTTMKTNAELSPEEVIKMPLKEFEERFGFRPVDALEKHSLASNAKRLGPEMR